MPRSSMLSRCRALMPTPSQRRRRRCRGCPWPRASSRQALESQLAFSSGGGVGGVQMTLREGRQRDAGRAGIAQGALAIDAQQLLVLEAEPSHRLRAEVFRRLAMQVPAVCVGVANAQPHDQRAQNYRRRQIATQPRQRTESSHLKVHSRRATIGGQGQVGAPRRRREGHVGDDEDGTSFVVDAQRGYALADVIEHALVTRAVQVVQQLVQLGVGQCARIDVQQVLPGSIERQRRVSATAGQVHDDASVLAPPEAARQAHQDSTLVVERERAVGRVGPHTIGQEQPALVVVDAYDQTIVT